MIAVSAVRYIDPSVHRLYGNVACTCWLLAPVACWVAARPSLVGPVEQCGQQCYIQWTLESFTSIHASAPPSPHTSTKENKHAAVGSHIGWIVLPPRSFFLPISHHPY